MLHIRQPAFEWSFLLPKYWLTWIGIAFMYCISWLPYKLQIVLGRLLGKVLGKVAKSRMKVGKRNLELCFPDMPEGERETLLKKNMESAGIALLETGMGWWWPDWRVKKRSKTAGFEHVEAILAKGKGVFGIAIHNMNLEMNCRVMGLTHPSIVFYRRHNNPVMEYFQYRGRARSNKYLIHKRGVKDMLQSLDSGEFCMYLPDQDFGPKRCEFVPLFAVPDTATTTGTLLFAENANCESVFVLPLRTEDGYVVKIMPGLDNFPSGDHRNDVTRLNKKIEEMIMQAPEQYLWMHKRFKTRPHDNPSALY
ncbi:LpxL/LpxP family Kdo(2)-lipid IV(A) lauroyl/palmitoleoyl acyltransferase [Alteromonadaceae bacterium BrNp21-10]|nr:LpxL/LpxP family Kdo(2)-lipid IV(A) lauroyl/palmitoleoyl acyltransferase [Alteromonadaceae bacterium BrNp21-10]